MNVYWLEQTWEDVSATEDWLSTSELDRLSALRFPKRREDWRLGRWTGKCAVAVYFGLSGHSIDLATIEIRAAASGAPEVVVEGEPAALTISLSHRDHTALCAVSSLHAALGCDLELIEPRSAAFETDYFTEQEQLLLARAGTGRLVLLALLWSAKESALKALRTGLRMDTRCLTVTLAGAADCEDWHRLHVDHAGRTWHGWWGCSEGFVRTLVAAPPSDPPIALVPSPILVPVVTEKQNRYAYR